MAPVKSITFSSLKNDIVSGRFSPVYLLHGVESYFIDELVKQFDSVIPETDRDFNMHTLYASQTEISDVISICHQYPLMADRQMVILKEAQSIKKSDLSKLAPYLANPNQMTVLVISYRGEKLESKPILDAVKQGGGIVFESKAVYESNATSYVKEIAKAMGVNIESDGINLLLENLGVDLSKLANEIEKLSMILGRGSMITPEAIELNVGISKEYNNRELVDAISCRNFVKAMKIVEYFKSNPKANPTVVTGATLFSFFSNLLICQFAPDKSPNALMSLLKMKFSIQMKPYTWGMKNYNAWQVIEIISLIREFDCNIKGNRSRQPEFTLLQELIYKILLAKGRI